MNPVLSYEETPEFQRDLKKLLKKYRSLVDDLDLVKRAAIELYHIRRIDNASVFPIPGFCTEEIQVCKIKKFACKALKGKGARSGVRVIYAFHTKILKIVFMEIYYKGNQENENKKRIEMYLDNYK
jgi:mRNA-degrading endonuclease RelE of RelBE toxin-antitoxin system